MSWLITLFIFITCWWISLFAFISAGTTRSATPVPGQSSGAPDSPGLRQKFLLALVISALITAIIYCLVAYSGLDVFTYDYYANRKI